MTINLPPIRVEMPVSKLQQLCDDVQHRMEEHVKESKPQQVVRDLQKKDQSTNKSFNAFEEGQNQKFSQAFQTWYTA